MNSFYVPKHRLLWSVALWCGLACGGFSYPVMADEQDSTQAQKPPPYPAWAVKPYAGQDSVKTDEKKSVETKQAASETKSADEKKSAEEKKSAQPPYPAWAVKPYQEPAVPNTEKRVVVKEDAPQEKTGSENALVATQDAAPSVLPVETMQETKDDQAHDALPQNKSLAAMADGDLSAPPVPHHAEPQTASAAVYQSPPPIIKKEVLHMMTQQPEMASTTPKPIIPDLTPEQLATLTPAAGDADSGVGAPLIQMPDQPSSALPSSASSTSDASGSNPPLPSPPAPPPSAAAPPLSDVKPLLAVAPPPAAPSQPLSPSGTQPPSPASAGSSSWAPDAASIDTLLKSMSEPSHAPANAPAITWSSGKKGDASERAEQGAVKDAQNNAEPEASLSPQSKKIADKIPNDLDRKKKSSRPIDIDHAKVEEDLGPAEPEVKTVKRDGMDISIQNKKPKIDVSYQLEQAYDALIGGQMSEAVELYKNVLSNDPKNKTALFGLATIYHRAGQLNLARSLYAQLLSIDPKNRDGLNNFLVLLADEAPEEALKQMEILEVHNPEFSPIPAQMGVIYEKLGDFDKASEKMFRAVQLAPENLAYRYNLAIIFDKQRKYDEAAKLYRDIIKAYQRGDITPGNIQKIQQRLTFISSNSG